MRTASPAPLYIAQERGWFREAGIEVAFHFFNAAQPIAAAAVSGDTDMGITALTGGFFALAGRGALVVIGGGLHEQKGVPLTAVLVSKAAHAAGLTPRWTSWAGAAWASPSSGQLPTTWPAGWQRRRAST